MLLLIVPGEMSFRFDCFDNMSLRRTAESGKKD
jgi:hypothetical protein